MPKTFVENTSSSPKTYFGRLLQPGESAWVESAPDPSPAVKQSLSQDPLTKRVYAGTDEVPGLSSAVSGAGNASAYGGGYNRRPLQHAAMPLGTTAINELVATGATASQAVDATDGFNGRACNKVTITAAGSNVNLEVGTTTATINLDTEAQLITQRPIIAAVKIGVGNTLANATLYLGDSGYTNFYTFGLDVGPVVNGWTLLTKSTPGATSTTGAPNLAAALRAKLRLTMTGNVQPGIVQVGGIYVVPKPAPTVVFMCDDGYSEWLWLMAEAKKRGVPISFGISYEDIGTAGILTEAELRSIINDTSGLFECTNHAHSNVSYTTLGLAPYLAKVKGCRDYLVARGGSQRAASCHAYVQGQYDQALINALKAEGFLCAREVGASNRRAITESIALAGAACDDLYRLPATVNLENTQNLATVKGYIQTAAENGAAVIMGHRFRATAGTIQWIAGYDPSYGVLDLLDWLALMRDTAGWRLMKLSDWHADMVATGARGPALLT